MTEQFNLGEALKAMHSGRSIGIGGVLAPLVKQPTEAVLEAEPDRHLAEDIMPNRKNGNFKKTLKTSSRSMELESPRDRAGTFEPQIAKKHQPSVSDQIRAKVMSMFGRA